MVVVTSNSISLVDHYVKITLSASSKAEANFFQQIQAVSDGLMLIASQLAKPKRP